MNDIQGYQSGPVETGASRAKEMSPRAYNLAMSALIFLGFCAMGAGAYFTSTMSFARMMMNGAALPLVFGSFILTIVGMVMMSAAASKQSVGLSLVGYVIFASTFGLTASFGLANYDLPTHQHCLYRHGRHHLCLWRLGRDVPQVFPARIWHRFWHSARHYSG